MYKYVLLIKDPIENVCRKKLFYLINFFSKEIIQYEQEKLRAITIKSPVTGCKENKLEKQRILIIGKCVKYIP